MIAIIDYGVGNLFSLRCSFGAIGEEAVVTGDRDVIRRADKIILPGVGAFGDAAEKLRLTGLGETVIEEARRGKGVVGICLGMQLLFRRSFEYGEHAGLGLLDGEVVGMKGLLPDHLKIPHIGWNALRFHKESRLISRIRENDCVYFVHSFFARGCEDALVATAEYGLAIPAVVQKENVMGCQFHPEKSGETGLAILKSFCGGD
ncbi:MAG: imidazole glycerol phosphate synthase subunit HisH [Clostridia bacterium]|nr:imidazole glycerol phosphate synthase subunit HisH [Clostridia bacterium]